SFEGKHVAGKKCDATRFLGQRRQITILSILYFARFYTRYGRKKSGLGRNRIDGGFGALGDIDSIANVGPAVSVFTIGDNNHHPPACHGSQFFVAELPDSIKQRGLISQLLYAVNRLV